MVGVGVSQVLMGVVICIGAAVRGGCVAAGRPAAKQRADGRRPAFEPGADLCSQFSHARPIATRVESQVQIERPHPLRVRGCVPESVCVCVCVCVCAYVLVSQSVSVSVSVSLSVCPPVRLSLSVFAYCPVLFTIRSCTAAAAAAIAAAFLPP